jgi:hypothetical protein
LDEFSSLRKRRLFFIDWLKGCRLSVPETRGSSKDILSRGLDVQSPCDSDRNLQNRTKHPILRVDEAQQSFDLQWKVVRYHAADRDLIVQE